MEARPCAFEVALNSSRPSRYTLSFDSGIGVPSLSRTVSRRMHGCCAELTKGSPMAKNKIVIKNWLHKLSRGMSIHFASLLRKS